MLVPKKSAMAAMRPWGVGGKSKIKGRWRLYRASLGMEKREDSVWREEDDGAGSVQMFTGANGLAVVASRFTLDVL